MSLERDAKLEMEKTLTRAKFPYLVEITYYRKDNTTEILRYANSDEDKEFTEIIDGESVTNTFYAGYFTIQLPQKTQSGITDAKINISAIDQSWIERIRNADKKKRSKIRFVATIEYENNSEESLESIEDMEFELTNASTDGDIIQWTMDFDPLADVKVPHDECNDRVCPALV